MVILLCSSVNAQNQNLSNGVVFDGEPFLAVNPNNAHHMVVGWMGYQLGQQIVIKTQVTTDAGNSWSSPIYIPHVVSSFGSADPSIRFNSSGDVFICYVDYDKVIDSGQVYVRKSIDGGLSWGNPVEVMDMHDDPNKKGIDRPWMVIDRSGGANDGNIYVTTMNPNQLTFGNVPSPYNPYLNVSFDGGNSFGPYRYLDTTGWLAGSVITQPMPTPAVTSTGTFHAVYPSYVASQNIFPQYILASSVDGGVDLSHQTVFATGQVAGATDAKSGYLLRANPSDSDHLAFFYLGPDNGDLDVFMRETFDGGATWTGQKRINDDPVANNRMQDLIWADFDNDGDLVVTWRDRRNGTDSTYQTSSEIWGAFRDKDSSNFSPNFRISDQIVAFDSILLQSGNDFMCVSLDNDTISTVWGDVRTGKMNIFFQRLTTDGTTVSVKQLASEEISNTQVFPNPGTDHVNIIGRAVYRVEMFSLNGQKVFDQSVAKSDNFKMNVRKYSPGVYNLRIWSDWGMEVLRFVISD